MSLPTSQLSIRWFALLLLMGCGSVATGFNVAKATDVGGLLLSPAVTVVPSGEIRSVRWNESVVSTTYDLDAPVSVQIACYGTTSGEWATRRARYQLRVTSDPDRHLRKWFLGEIHDYWRSQPPGYVASYENLPADKSVVEKNGSYVLYIKPGHEREGATFLFYASGSVFELEFKSIEGDGWGALSTFIAENVAFREAGQIIGHIYFEPKYPPLKLMRQIETGELR